MKIKQAFKSRQAKKIYFVGAMFLLLFFITNDVLLPWYVNSGGIIEVPNVVGKKFEDAKKLLGSVGLETHQGDVRMDRERPAGTVIIQNPVDGAKVKRGRRVYLTISGGEVQVIAPNLKGRTLRDAKFTLEREGLKLGAVEYEPSDQFPANTVIEQRVASGTKVKRDSYISVVISQGSTNEKVTVPNLSGKTLNEASKLLESLGLKAGNVSYVPSPDLLPNTVVEQFPHPGELVTNGQAVDLFIVQAVEKKKEIFEN